MGKLIVMWQKYKVSVFTNPLLINMNWWKNGQWTLSGNSQEMKHTYLVNKHENMFNLTHNLRTSNQDNNERLLIDRQVCKDF